MAEIQIEQKSKRRASGLLLARTYVIPVEKPREVFFSEHLPNFDGYKPFEVNPDLIWGVFGTDSLNRCDAYASMDAQHMKRELYQVDLYYNVKNIPASNASISKEVSLASGYIYLARLESSFRNELHEIFKRWLTDAKDPDIGALRIMTVEDLIKARPMLVHRYMKENPDINVFLHSVKISGGVSIRLCTMRKLPDRIEQIAVRYHKRSKPNSEQKSRPIKKPRSGQPCGVFYWRNFQPVSRTKLA